MSQEPAWKGYYYATLLLLISVTQNLLTAQFNNGFALVGIRIQTALTAAIYKKSLQMSQSSRKDFTVGEIVNLMSVDAQRFTDLININSAWLAPIQIFISLYFLWDILGVATLAGLAVMILLIPVNAWCAKMFTSQNTRQMKYKDKRMKMTTEVLNGIKVLKLYAWEPSFQEEILKIRGKEVQVLRDEAYVGAAVSLIWSWAPFLVSVKQIQYFYTTELD